MTHVFRKPVFLLLGIYHSLGICGISSYAEPGDWATYEMNHYMLGALAWNPETNLEPLIRNFLLARFGSDSSSLLEIFSHLERHAPRLSSIPFTSLKSPAEYGEAIALFQSLIDKTRKLEQNSPSPQTRKAFHRLSLCLQYLVFDMSLLKARVLNDDVSKRKESVEKLLQFLQNHPDDGVFIPRHISANSLYSRYGVPKSSKN
ncbi:hypothetical protein JW926_00015 [Candidatus Sumerlaeota bacterium]|nr:hypothetical protein [Candidatus Sumerlaeota bacterium]